MRTGRRTFRTLVERRLLVAVPAAAVATWTLAAPWFPSVLAVGVVALIAAAVAVWGRPPAVLAIIVTAAVVAVIMSLPTLNNDTLAAAIVTGLMVALALAAPALIADVVAQRRTFRLRGWVLADAVARSRAAEVEAALQRERMAMAAEMHDGLGHRLTLLAVQLGRLSLTPGLPTESRVSLEQARASAADAVEELGASVDLLHRPGGSLGAPHSPEDVIAQARAAGITVVAAFPSGLDHRLGPDARAGAVRILQETLTNAAKHAPGEPVDVQVEIEKAMLHLTVSTPLATWRTTPRPGGGFGLLSLRTRTAVLGGALTTTVEDSSFIVRATLPTHGRPAHTATAEDEQVVAAEREAAAQAHKTATRVAVTWPAAILAGIALVAGGVFVLSNTLAVLDREEFARIAPGDDRSATEAALPSWEMLDPPRVVTAADETCRYFESEVDYFERADVFVICFEGEQVSRTEEVPAP